MYRSWILLLAVGCFGTCDVEPDWLNEGPVGEDGEGADLEAAACGEEDTGAVTGRCLRHDRGLATERARSIRPHSAPTPPTPRRPEWWRAHCHGSQCGCDTGEYFVGGLSNPRASACSSASQTVMSAPTAAKFATGVDFDDVKDLGDGDVFED